MVRFRRLCPLFLRSFIRVHLYVLCALPQFCRGLALCPQWSFAVAQSLQRPASRALRYGLLRPMVVSGGELGHRGFTVALDESVQPPLSSIVHQTLPPTRLPRARHRAPLRPLAEHTRHRGAGETQERRRRRDAQASSPRPHHTTTVKLTQVTLLPHQEESHGSEFTGDSRM